MPESIGVLPDFRGDVEFRFDEVVSEGSAPSQGTGTGDLEKLILLSPTTEVPNVRWRRNRITVSPNEGWKPNRVYRVQLLPGITDLRRNRADTGVVVTFTTGAPVPRTTLQGTVVDWTTGRPVPGALVVAVLRPDSLPYRAIADSSGKFSLGPLPQGEYIVYGIVDQNRDQRQDSRDAYDSVRIAAGQTNVGELWAFVHDTNPPRIQTVTVDDSVSATLTFSQMLDPRQRLEPGAASLRLLPDSTPVAVASILPKPVDDSLHQRTAPRDTARARDTLAAAAPDTLAAAETLPGETPRVTIGAGGRDLPTLTSRPPLFDRLVLRIAKPWRPGARYALEIRGVRNVTGVTGDVKSVVTVAERKPLQAADSLKAPSTPKTPPARPGSPAPPPRQR